MPPVEPKQGFFFGTKRGDKIIDKDEDVGNGSQGNCSDAVARRRVDALSYGNSQISMLQPDEESAYAKRWREQGDREAAYHLVTSHLRLVAKIAMRYRGYGLPIADIISEGNVGLMQAVKRFEPERGVRLATYRTKAEISALEDGDLSPEHTAMVATKLGVQENDVLEMNRRLGGDASLNTLVNADEAGEVQDWLVDPASDPEAVFAEQQEARQRHQALAGALEVLNPRERHIYLKRGSCRNRRSGLRTWP